MIGCWGGSFIGVMMMIVIRVSSVARLFRPCRWRRSIVNTFSPTRSTCSGSTGRRCVVAFTSFLRGIMSIVPSPTMTFNRWTSVESIGGRARWCWRTANTCKRSETCKTIKGKLSSLSLSVSVSRGDQLSVATQQSFLLSLCETHE